MFLKAITYLTIEIIRESKNTYYLIFLKLLNIYFFETYLTR